MRYQTTIAWQDMPVQVGDFIQNQGSYGVYLCAEGTDDIDDSIRLGPGDRTMQSPVAKTIRIRSEQQQGTDVVVAGGWSAEA